VVLSVFCEVHNRNLARESESAPELTATSAQPKVRSAHQRHVARNPARHV